MHREGRFRVWRPKLSCVECRHPFVLHPRFGKCTAPDCVCKRYVAKVNPKKQYAKGQIAYGKKHDSGLEARVAADLMHQLACGELQDVKRPFPIDIKIDGQKILRHYVDFRIVYNDGTVELVEAKGWWDEFSKLKRALVENVYLKQNPGVKYRVLRP